MRRPKRPGPLVAADRSKETGAIIAGYERNYRYGGDSAGKITNFVLPEGNGGGFLLEEAAQALREKGLWAVYIDLSGPGGSPEGNLLDGLNNLDASLEGGLKGSFKKAFQDIRKSRGTLTLGVPLFNVALTPQDRERLENEKSFKIFEMLESITENTPGKKRPVLLLDNADPLADSMEGVRLAAKIAAMASMCADVVMRFSDPDRRDELKAVRESAMGCLEVPIAIAPLGPQFARDMYAAFKGVMKDEGVVQVTEGIGLSEQRDVAEAWKIVGTHAKRFRELLVEWVDESTKQKSVLSLVELAKLRMQQDVEAANQASQKFKELPSTERALLASIAAEQFSADQYPRNHETLRGLMEGGLLKGIYPRLRVADHDLNTYLQAMADPGCARIKATNEVSRLQRAAARQAISMMPDDRLSGTEQAIRTPALATQSVDLVFDRHKKIEPLPVVVVSRAPEAADEPVPSRPRPYFKRGGPVAR